MSRQHPKTYIVFQQIEYNYQSKLAMGLDVCILNIKLTVKSLQLY